MKKLNATALGLAFGIVWAVAMFLVVVISMYADWGGAFVNVMGSVYVGIESTWTGAFLALPWGFVDGFIGLYLMGWLYNKFA